MNVAIIGASGYSGEELVRMLSSHPNIKLAVVTSRKNKGKLVADVIPNLRHAVGDLQFIDSDPDFLAQRNDIEVFFLALPHGVASEYAEPLFDAGKTVIDLSADFRLNSEETYTEYYGHLHPASHLLAEAPYVIPELSTDEWKNAKLISCPGCYPTSILIPLVPLIQNGIIHIENIVINSYSGVSGAGRKVSEDWIYCERNESIKGYGMPLHRHISEIEEQLSIAAGKNVLIQFNPHIAPMSRGISTTIVAKAGNSSIESLYNTWNNAFSERIFIGILNSGEFPDTRHVMGTNRCDMSALLDARTGNFVITSVIDNLVKGAGGQAVQIMNLKFGFDEFDALI